MGLNPNYSEENDWEVISANGSDDQSSVGEESEEEEDLIVDDGDEAELHRQLLPSSCDPDIEQNDLLEPNLMTQADEDCADEEQDGVNQNSGTDGDDVQNENTAVEDASEDAADEETTPLISEESDDLKDMVVVSNEDASKDEKEEEPRDTTDSNNFSQDSNQDDAEVPPPQSEEPKGPQAFVAAIGASVKHLGDAIGMEGQKIGLVVQKEGHKIGSSIQKESQKLGKALEEETKRIGEATQRVFKPRRSPSPSSPHARHRAEHTSRSPPRGDRTAAATTTAEETPSLIANVLTGAVVLVGGILLARGNKGAGAALLATGGATYMANEAAKESRRFDTNLNEELGMRMN